MPDPFEIRLRDKVNALSDGAWERLGQLDMLSEEVGKQVVGILLAQASQSQHMGNIQAARLALARIPEDYLVKVLPDVITSELDLNDEWEYRRLLEFLRKSTPQLLVPYIEYGLRSNRPEIHEAALDFSI